MAKTIVGIFDNHSQAEGAARQVSNSGLRTDDISIVSKDYEGNLHNQAGMVNDNISDGTVTGGLWGGGAGLLLGMGALAIPGLGVIGAAGPVAGLLSGALTGGVVGGLVDLGIPEQDSQSYERDIEGGKIFWSMDADDENIDTVIDILRTAGAESVDYY